MGFKEQFRKARLKAVPIVGIETVNQQATLAEIVRIVGKNAMITWDVVAGLKGENKGFLADGKDPDTFQGQAGVVVLLAELGKPGMPPEVPFICQPGFPALVVCLLNAQRYVDDPAVMQGISNLRDSIKMKEGMMLVLLGPTLMLPAELTQDVLVLQYPLPRDEELNQVIEDTYVATPMMKADRSPEFLARARDALRGSSLFAAEQSCALATTKEGLSLEILFDRKKQLVRSTDGLMLPEPPTTDVYGYEQAGAFLDRLMKGPAGYRAIFFIDEIEKMLGRNNDMSGVSQKVAALLLAHMANTNVSGLMFFGIAGCGKSAISQRCAKRFDVPFIEMDYSAMENSLVGETEKKVRTALAVEQSIGQGRSLWIATCNGASVLSGPLFSRFDMARFFFDTPSKEERAGIWPIWIEKYGLGPNQAIPTDEGWTGREIKACCKIAWSLGVGLVEAATYVIPLVTARPGEILAARREAHGKFLSASYPGAYQCKDWTGEETRQPSMLVVSGVPMPAFSSLPQQEMTPTEPLKRKIGFGEDEKEGG